MGSLWSYAPIEQEFAQIVHVPREESGCGRTPRTTRMYLSRVNNTVRLSLSVWAPPALQANTKEPVDVYITLSSTINVALLRNAGCKRFKDVNLHECDFACTEYMLFRGTKASKEAQFGDNNDKLGTDEDATRVLVYSLYSEAVRRLKSQK